MRILIIRHAEPDYPNKCITPQGEIEAKCLAEYLKDEKIDYMYCSPLNRAKLTAEKVEKVKNMKSTVVEWLREFAYRIEHPNGDKSHLIWDFTPEFYYSYPDLRDEKKWLDVDFIKKADIKKYYDDVCENLDALLLSHGYKRNNAGFYDVVKSNRDTVALFCHFGVECVMLSHLFNMSPVVLLQGSISAPTGITTLYSEEMQKGQAIFRLNTFGDISHLCMKGLKPSFAGRFAEINGEDYDPFHANQNKQGESTR